MLFKKYILHNTDAEISQFECITDWYFINHRDILIKNDGSGKYSIMLYMPAFIIEANGQDGRMKFDEFLTKCGVEKHRVQMSEDGLRSIDVWEMRPEVEESRFYVSRQLGFVISK